MKNNKKNSNAERFIRSYENMRGLNLLAGNESTDSFCYLENMYVDYEGGGGAIESIPGFRRIHSFEAAVQLICSVGEYIIIRAGDGLYKIKKKERDNIPALLKIASLDGENNQAYLLGEGILITDGRKFIKVSEAGEATELIAPKELSECRIGTTHEGRLLLGGGSPDPCALYCAEICGEGSISANHVLCIPKNALALASAYGYLWVFTTDSVLGYKRVENKLLEEFRLGGISPTGQVCIFNGELTFLTKSGLCSILAKENFSLAERSVAINPMLLNEDLLSARLDVWRGYLVVSIGGRMYLADSRDMLKSGKCNEYRWYYLNGIGTYRGDKRVYRYAEVATDGFLLHETPGQIADGEVMSLVNERGEKIYFVTQDKNKYAVYPTEQMRGGLFFPAICIGVVGDLLLFSTECGDLCLFNNDMRGKAPREIANMADFDEAEYVEGARGRIHPAFYSFNGHAPRYALLTPRDKCGMPFERKSDLPSSLALTLKSFPTGSIIVETRYDGGKFGNTRRISNSSFDFYNIDFEAHSSSSEELSTVYLSQRRACWTEKQISIYSKDFCSPFGIYSICFAYKSSKKLRKEQNERKKNIK